jgi:transposase
VLDSGPAAAGYADQCWTLARVADQAWQRFEAEYTLAGMDVLLHRIGWTVQVPARRAAERDEDKVARLGLSTSERALRSTRVHALLPPSARLVTLEAA